MKSQELELSGYWNSEVNTNNLKLFYEAIVGDDIDGQRAAFVVLNHALPDTYYFLQALSRVGFVEKVFVKPRSIDCSVLKVISSRYDTEKADRAKFHNPNFIVSLLKGIAEKRSVPVIALDVGGYFSYCLDDISSQMGERFLGVIEDTENGHQKYEQKTLPTCVYSVARSPLKYCEDVLVGYSITNATENIIRKFGDIHCPKVASVLGYGKIGKSTAEALSSKGIRVGIYDIDAVKLVQASADGFQVYKSLEASLDSDIIISCTGNLAIGGSSFGLIKNGAYVSCATSADDEIDLKSIDGLYDVCEVGEHIQLYKGTNLFYLLYGGNAVNFTYGASAGNYITLVHAEMVVCVKQMLKQGDLVPGFQELDQLRRREVAKCWIETFTP